VKALVGNAPGIAEDVTFHFPRDAVREKLLRAYRSAKPEARKAAAESILLRPPNVRVGLLDIAQALGDAELALLIGYAENEGATAFERIARELYFLGFDDAETSQTHGIDRRSRQTAKRQASAGSACARCRQVVSA
jgi:hypothetical protein